MPWIVYLARCRDGTLYTGITTDPARRLAEHNAGHGAAYTRTRLPVIFVYGERVPDRSSALRREHAIKRLNRAAKEALAKNIGVMPGIAGPHPALRGL
jgi:putative endonuclease